MTAALIDESMTAVKQQMESGHVMGGIGETVEIANAILFLASDEASFVTGHPPVVDGGWTAGTVLSP